MSPCEYSSKLKSVNVHSWTLPFTDIATSNKLVIGKTSTGIECVFENRTKELEDVIWIGDSNGQTWV